MNHADAEHDAKMQFHNSAERRLAKLGESAINIICKEFSESQSLKAKGATGQEAHC